MFWRRLLYQVKTDTIHEEHLLLYQVQGGVSLPAITWQFPQPARLPLPALPPTSHASAPLPPQLSSASCKPLKICPRLRFLGSGCTQRETRFCRQNGLASLGVRGLRFSPGHPCLPRHRHSADAAMWHLWHSRLRHQSKAGLHVCGTYLMVS